MCPADTLPHEPHAQARLILSENLTLDIYCNPALGRLSREDFHCEVSQLRSKVRISTIFSLVSKYEGHTSQALFDNVHFTACPVCPHLHPPNNVPE